MFHTISGSSGGHLTSSLYHFARDITTAELLDSDGISDPSQITTEILENIPENSIFRPYAEGSADESLVRTIIFTSIFGTDFWSTFVSIHMLERFGYGIEGTPMTEVSIRDGVKSEPICIASMVGPSELFPGWPFLHMFEGVSQEWAPASITEDYFVEGNESFNQFIQQTYLINNNSILELIKKYGYQIAVPGFAHFDVFHVPFEVTDTMTFDPVGNATAEDLNFRPFTVTVEKFVGMPTNVNFDFWSNTS